MANTGKGEPRVTANAIPASRATAVGKKNEAAKSATKSIRAAHWRDVCAVCTACAIDVAVVFMPRNYNFCDNQTQHTFLYAITFCYTRIADVPIRVLDYQEPPAPPPPKLPPPKPPPKPPEKPPPENPPP